MKTNKVFSAVVLCAFLLHTSCSTNLYLNFGNGTGLKILVKDVQTGQEVQIAPGKSQKIGHGQADLVVTTPEKTHYVFTGVRVADPEMDTRYFSPGSKSICGSGSFGISVLLQTNMELFVLLPGKKTVDPTVPQPNGYPKTGTKMAE